MCKTLNGSCCSLAIFALCCVGCEDATPNRRTVTNTSPTKSRPSRKIGSNREDISDRFSSVPLVTPSADGWTISTQSRPDAEFDTIIRSPSGQRFNAGSTGVPDYHRPILWILEPPGLKRKLLLIYLSPVASGPSTLSVYLIRNDHIVCKAAQVAHHFEWTKETAPSRITHQLFRDQNDDGTPELIADDVGKSGGTVTFLEFNGRIFSPRWRETYKLDEDDKLSLASRHDLRGKRQPQ